MKIITTIVISCVILISIPSISTPDIYMFVDKKGITHFTDAPNGKKAENQPTKTTTPVKNDLTPVDHDPFAEETPPPNNNCDCKKQKYHYTDAIFAGCTEQGIAEHLTKDCGDYLKIQLSLGKSYQQINQELIDYEGMRLDALNKEKNELHLLKSNPIKYLKDNGYVSIGDFEVFNVFSDPQPPYSQFLYTKSMISFRLKNYRFKKLKKILNKNIQVFKKYSNEDVWVLCDGIVFKAEALE